MRSEAAKCKNVKVLTAAGGGDLQKSISDVSTMVAQGANAITIIPDFGQAQLQSLKDATAQGVKVVPWGANPGGTQRHRLRLVRRLERRLSPARCGPTGWSRRSTARATSSTRGGPAGNPVGAAQLAAVVAVFKKNPGMKLLTGTKDWPVTNWDPATAQKVTCRAARQVPEDRRDHLQLRHGRPRERARVPGRRPEARPGHHARRERARAASTRRTALAFRSTISSRNWLGRIAARKAIAAAEGLPNKEAEHLQAVVLRGHARR